jgi:hypothetical protein
MKTKLENDALHTVGHDSIVFISRNVCFSLRNFAVRICWMEKSYGPNMLGTKHDHTAQENITNSTWGGGRNPKMLMMRTWGVHYIP